MLTSRFAGRVLGAAVLLLVLVLLAPAPSVGQEKGQQPANYDDFQNMLDQLGIKFPAFYEWAGQHISTPGLTKKK